MELVILTTFTLITETATIFFDFALLKLWMANIRFKLIDQGNKNPSTQLCNPTQQSYWS